MLFRKWIFAYVVKDLEKRCLFWSTQMGLKYNQMYYQIEKDICLPLGFSL